MKADYFVKTSTLQEVQQIVEHSHFIEKELSCPVFENAYILPFRPFNAGVVDNLKQGIQGTQACERYRIGYPFDEESVVKENEGVIYMGYMKSVFGHCITDDIKRVWFLFSEEYKRLEKKGVQCVYILPEDKKISDAFVSLMEVIGIDVHKWRKITTNTQFSSVYVPDNSLIYNNGERYWTKEFKGIVDRIKFSMIGEKCPEEKSFPKLYFSRSDFADVGKEFGEKTLEIMFRVKGFEIIHPETLSFRQQLQLVASCQEFVATEGSVSHWALFCAPRTRVVLLRKANYVNTYQVAINEVADVKVTYIDAHYSHVDERWPWGGPFYLFDTPQLQKYMGLSVHWFPVWCYPSYWWYQLKGTKWMKKYVANRKVFRNIEKRIL